MLGGEVHLLLEKIYPDTYLTVSRALTHKPWSDSILKDDVLIVHC